MRSLKSLLKPTIIILCLLGVMWFYGTQSSPLVAATEKQAPAYNSSTQTNLTPISAAPFDAIVLDSKAQPTFIMIYASWCPHCKRMFAQLNTLQAQHKEAVRIIAISIDNNHQNTQAFVESITPLHLEHYVIADASSYRLIGDRLRRDGLKFQGGISKSVGVPYNVVYHHGAPVAEFSGALPPEKLDMLITDMVRAP